VTSWVGYTSTVLTANTAGLQVAVCGPDAAKAAGATVMSGYLKRLVITGDATGTIDVYDGLSTAGKHLLSWTKTNTPWYDYDLDLIILVGLFVVVAGATAPLYTLEWS
jgi:hypothetical protein